MIYLILFLLFILTLPWSLAGLVALFHYVDMVFREGFSDPDILIVIFATIAAVWFLGVWGKAGKGRKKKTE